MRERERERLEQRERGREIRTRERERDIQSGEFSNVFRNGLKRISFHVQQIQRNQLAREEKGKVRDNLSSFRGGGGGGREREREKDCTENSPL